MGLILRRDVPFSSPLQPPTPPAWFIHPSLPHPATCVHPFEPLADVLWPSVALLVFWSPQSGRLRGTAGWVQWLEGSLLLANTSVPPARAFHLFIFWVLQTSKSLNSTHTHRHKPHVTHKHTSMDTYMHKAEIKKDALANSWEWQSKISHPNLIHPHTCLQ